MISIFYRIQNKLKKLRLQPIRVFCLHHVCEQFDPETMHECDWMALDVFKQKVLAMQQRGVRFISLTEAHKMLAHSLSPLAFRLNRLAVLTFDDGYASLKEVLPWLKEQGIPVTLFVNPDYAEGRAYRESPKESYLTLEELSATGVEIGMHGAQHLDASRMNEAEFRAFAEDSINKSSIIKNYIPFWAYTWVRHTETTDQVVKDKGITPVYMDGAKNYNDANCIHRELLN